jgi:intein/homing endonuclease
MKKIYPKAAELIGMHIGDGTLYRTNRGMVWELRGSLDEKEYYDNNVVSLLMSIFLGDYRAKFRSGGKNGCYGVQTSRKELTSFLLRYDFKPGTKTYTVRIPDYVKYASKKIKFSFLRGIFDTDGCLRFDKNHTKRNYYPKIEFSSASVDLITDLSLLLTTLDFQNYIWKCEKGAKLCISGQNMLHKWMKEIRPKNPKHLNKYDKFLRTGYVVPYAEMAQPGTALT